jgi:hypothetical protein
MKKWVRDVVNQRTMGGTNEKMDGWMGGLTKGSGKKTNGRKDTHRRSTRSLMLELTDLTFPLPHYRFLLPLLSSEPPLPRRTA